MVCGYGLVMGLRNFGNSVTEVLIRMGRRAVHCKFSRELSQKICSCFSKRFMLPPNNFQPVLRY